MRPQNSHLSSHLQHQPSTIMSRQSNTHRTSLQAAFCLAFTQLYCTHAFAEVDFVPHATANYEYNSNLFLVPENGQPRTDSQGEPRLEERQNNYSGGLDLRGTWEESKLTISSDIKKSTYKFFDDLNRTDQLYSFNYDWVATRKVSGKLNGRYDKHLTPFIDVVNPGGTAATAENLTQVDRMAGAGVNYQLNSHWQLLTEAAYSLTTMPAFNPGASYDVKNISEKLGAKYSSNVRLAWGMNIDRNDGAYSGASNAPEYHSTRYQGTLDYEIGPRTHLNSNLGYSKYSQGETETSGIVGGLNISYQLTKKTTVYVRYDNTLNTYAATQGSQRGSAWASGVKWQMLAKVTVAANYSESRSTYNGFLVEAQGSTNYTRADTFRYSEALIDYSIRPWLSLNGYYRYQKRTSEDSNFNFNNRIYGANLAVRFE